MAYYDFLNVVFFPLLRLPPALAIILMSLLVSVLIIVITKFTTDQVLMKKLKEDLKDHQKQIKELRNNPSKAMEVQKKAMELNMKYMSHSFKPTLITLIPIILIFGWMSSIFAFEPINPGEEFSVTAIFQKNTIGEAKLASETMKTLSNSTQEIKNNQARWRLKGEEGTHKVSIAHGNEEQEREIIITNTNQYLEPEAKNKGVIKSIRIDYEKKKVLNIFGWKLGWLGTYILSSIIFTLALRKIFKVY